MRNIKNIDFIEGSNIAILEEYCTDRWNALAERTNTKSFIRMTGRQPVNYEEVQMWVKGLSEGKEKAATLADATAELIHAL
ncbi:hypothetical protein NXZ77_03560 [Lysinibacillus boronitolerans]|uniref:hypothetical protein n=1 Tax=Lysinibacillus boronitolerans TaxID=309788 RepID=UPI002162A2D8|nr:hypothetical protein [Lysinibacillus boronitolerans]MCS1390628.1 hypothetical protein [Lysinibacillus boronitolerans]